MESNRPAEIVFIDDDRLSNMVCAKILNVIFPELPVVSFTHPKQGLAYLLEEENRRKSIILFLDINMPGMSGFAVLEDLAAMPGFQQSNLKIYVLSATINSAEMEKAERHPLVNAYVAKPLSIDIFKALLS